ncbi:MAG: helix-turn-helix domain-containing protein [Eubacteriales bacterium]|nr:helix-turn-helix domain-containing protein [Eubacteriales bacterium]
MYKNYINNFSKNLKTRRKQLGFTQEKICEKLDISYSHYVKLENGINAPSFETLINISNVLNTSIDSLIFKSIDNDIKLNDLFNKVADYDEEKLKIIKDFINFLLDTKDKN